MADKLPPAILKPAIFTPIWSGNRLSETYDSYKSHGKIGEAWLTSAEEKSPSCAVIGGEMMDLGKYLKLSGISVPPLVKLLDAGAPLSIQVHPDDIAASKYGGISKSEMWYVLSADPGAEIIYGSKDGITAEDLRMGISSGEIEQMLRHIPVAAGDVFMIPPGMIHSLGAGVTVLEVQDRAGTTYRVKDIAGNREIHPEESADSVRVYSYEEAAMAAISDPYRLRKRPLPGETLASADGFAVTHFIAHEVSESLSVDNGGTFVFCESGRGKCGGISFSAGDSLFFGDPCDVSLDPGSSLIFVI